MNKEIVKEGIYSLYVVARLSYDYYIKLFKVLILAFKS